MRERIWALLEEHNASRFPGARGRIPNFRGAEAASERLAGLAEWLGAATVKANPDAPQLPVRARALGDGKIVYMAVPRLADPLPFMLLDPSELSVTPRSAASIKGASRHARRVAVQDLPHLDLVVCGSVAVNRIGVRVGKGGGYSDLEFALAAEAGVVDRATTIATTVHPLQVVDGDLPETGHDFRVDLIVTPEEVVRVGSARRPKGIIWRDLDDEKIASVPAVAALRAERTPQ